jgi:cell division transport system permease protein
LSLALLFFLFDLFWVAARTSEAFYHDLISQMQMDVYIAETMPDSLLGELETSIGVVEGVRSVQFLSREQARQELARQIGTDLLVGYDTLNPLPRSFVLNFEPRRLTLSAMTAIEDELAIMPGVADINYSRQWLQKAEKTKSIILRVGLALGAIIVLTALISSANSIRLMTRARAVGFRQLRLLGAGRLFIAFPFLLEGILMAGLAAAAGWAAIVYGRTQVAFTRFDIVMPTENEIIAFCLGCAVLGCLSVHLGLRKQLRT